MASSDTEIGTISADDLAVIAAVVVIIGDALALWAVWRARAENLESSSAGSKAGDRSSRKKS
ncbi:hypothetical protein [Paenibacillus protaetiae]|uniref:Uncharacterized protein n=1 Tax=Paenibacillus protaetiae TaxID=2509456 RepID=A0A4V0YEU8_9BACL|nr:hypothetical protein [Paenibacillus protaetiae]QAY65461.1 hypothetical protein ET464_02785 [Paenibacillus protaetiae]